jgi:hypothetical protein
MMPWWKEYKEYIVTVTLFCFGFGLVWFVIIPQQTLLKQQLSIKEEVATRYEIREKSIEKLPSFQVQRSRIEEKELQLNRVISRDSIVDLIKIIEGLEDKTHTIITIDAKEDKPVVINKSTTKTQKSDEEKTLVELLPSSEHLKISLTVKGKYQDIVWLLQKLESMYYLTDIVSFSLANQSVDTTTPKIRTDIFSTLPSPENQSNDAESATPKNDREIEAVFDVVVYVAN